MGMADPEVSSKPRTSIDISIYGRSLEIGGFSWIYYLHPLAVPYSISTKLRTVSAQSPEFLLDWHDMANHIDSARMHMYVGESKQVDFQTKLERMEKLTKAIQAYNSLMVETPNGMPIDELERLLDAGSLPRLKEVVLDTGTAGLRRLYGNFHFPTSAERPHPFIVPWATYVDIARSGELVDAWKSQKTIHHTEDDEWYKNEN